jgi:ABC-type lipoprotein release transport system permease subunit
MLLKLAWKNIWRNKKRTLIVTTSVFFAVVLSSLMRSAQIGSFDYMIQSLAHIHLGYAQIQNPQFQGNHSLDNSIQIDTSRVSKIRQTEYITGSAYRLETFALLSSDTLTRITQVIGIDPLREESVTAIRERVSKGDYLNPGDNDILIGDDLAAKLGLAVNDTVALLSTGYHGMSAAALLKIKGILHFPINPMNKIMLYMDINKAQTIFSMPGMATSFVITVDHIDHLPTVISKLNPMLTAGETIRSWQDLMPEIEQTITMKTGSSYIMIGILYMVIGFGIFGVIMMMTMEREKEYGILNSLGMHKYKMISVSLAENFFIVILGVGIGMLCSIPVVSFLAENPIHLTGEVAKSWEQLGVEPIMTFSNTAAIFLYQSLIVFIIAALCSLYPLLFLYRLKIVNALKK